MTSSRHWDLNLLQAVHVLQPLKIESYPILYKKTLFLPTISNLIIQKMFTPRLHNRKTNWDKFCNRIDEKISLNEIDDAIGKHYP